MSRPYAAANDGGPEGLGYVLLRRHLSEETGAIGPGEGGAVDQAIDGSLLERLGSLLGGGGLPALLRTLAAVCVERGYSRLEWSVLDWNTPSIEFYDTAVAGAPERRARRPVSARSRMALSSPTMFPRIACSAARSSIPLALNAAKARPWRLARTGGAMSS